MIGGILGAMPGTRLTKASCLKGLMESMGCFGTTSIFQLVFSAAFVKELLTICFCNKECSDTIGWKQVEILSLGEPSPD